MAHIVRRYLIQSRQGACTFHSTYYYVIYMTVYSFQIPLHEQEECPKAVRACPFAEFGCDFKVSVSQSKFEVHNMHVLLKVFQK